MYLVLATMLGGGALLLLALQPAPGPELPATQQARAQLQQYQVFLHASLAYFRQASAPLVTTAYGWNDIRAAAAPSMRTAGMPPNWKAVRRPDGYWVACTELAETTLVQLPALYPAPLRPAAGGSAALLAYTVPVGSIGPATGAGGRSQSERPSYVVLGQQDAEAATSASLCSDT